MRIATRLDADTSIVTCAKLLYFTTRVAIYIATVKTKIYEKSLLLYYNKFVSIKFRSL